MLQDANLKQVGLGATVVPEGLKFKMADTSKHSIILNHNIFRVYIHSFTCTSHDIYILVFCTSFWLDVERTCTCLLFSEMLLHKAVLV